MTELDDPKMRLEAYSSALHELVGALANIRSAAEVALHRGTPLDPQWVLDVTNGRFRDSDKQLARAGRRGDGSSEYWAEAKEVRELLTAVADQASPEIQAILDAAEVVEDRFSDRFAGLDRRREQARALRESWR